jgi:uncharacterized protein (TIGR02453 family)
MPAFSGFPQSALQFFNDLALNNNREWFKAHESIYQQDVIPPAQAFIQALGERLKTLSPAIGYDLRPNGSGSLMRIYRDVRFSQDKSPYNTALRVIFWEGGGKKDEAPGYYFGMDARGGKLYAGMHGFSKELLLKYRQAVDDARMGKALEGAAAAVKGAGAYTIGDETYKRVPAPYPADHARASWLRFSSLYALSPQIEPARLTSPELVDVCFEHCCNMAPLQEWLVRLVSAAD